MKKRRILLPDDHALTAKTKLKIRLEKFIGTL